MINKNNIVLVTVFILFFVYWLFLQLFGNNVNEDYFYYFTSAYSIVALVGGLYGIKVSKQWGGTKSKLGKALTFLSLALIFQFTAQQTYTIYYYLLNVEIPYPSIGDIFYIIAVSMNIYATWLLAHTVGAKFKLKNNRYKLLALLFPVFMLIFTFYVFLLGNIDYSNPTILFFDLFYPLSQALLVAMAILCFIFSRNLLGGVMRSAILLLLVAIVFEYVADTIFLYSSMIGSWEPADISDFLYMTSYFVMAYAILNFDSSKLEKINAKDTSE